MLLSRYLKDIPSNPIPAAKKAAYHGDALRALETLWEYRESPKMDSEAKRLLGVLLLDNGETAEAVEWLQRAAAEGDVVAMFNLGRTYERGDLGEPRPQLALTWYEAASRAGDLDASFNLGLACFQGTLLERDHKRAVAFFRQAAERGHPQACFSLGVMFLRGYGLDASDVDALRWFRVAAHLKHPHAEDAIRRVLQRKGCPSRTSEERVRGAKR